MTRALLAAVSIRRPCLWCSGKGQVLACSGHNHWLLCQNCEGTGVAK